jgi:hypothetical protein
MLEGLLGRALAYLVLGLGMGLLFRGFILPSPLQAVLGGVMVLGGMYLVVRARRSAIPLTTELGQEESPGDTVH